MRVGARDTEAARLREGVAAGARVMGDHAPALRGLVIHVGRHDPARLHALGRHDVDALEHAVHGAVHRLHAMHALRVHRELAVGEDRLERGAHGGMADEARAARMHASFVRSPCKSDVDELSVSPNPQKHLDPSSIPTHNPTMPPRARHFAALLFFIAAAALFSARTFFKSGDRLWDFEIYSLSTRAYLAGQNPYDHSALERLWRADPINAGT